MPQEQTLQTELNFYQKHKQEYLKLHKGQFVLIKGEKFSGAYTTDAEAYKAGLDQFVWFAPLSSLFKLPQSSSSLIL